MWRSGCISVSASVNYIQLTAISSSFFSSTVLYAILMCEFIALCVCNECEDVEKRKGDRGVCVCARMVVVCHGILLFAFIHRSIKAGHRLRSFTVCSFFCTTNYTKILCTFVRRQRFLIKLKINFKCRMHTQTHTCTTSDSTFTSIAMHSMRQHYELRCFFFFPAFLMAIEVDAMVCCACIAYLYNI